MLNPHDGHAKKMSNVAAGKNGGKTGKQWACSITLRVSMLRILPFLSGCCSETGVSEQPC
jgi:hypothetical protein